MPSLVERLRALFRGGDTSIGQAPVALPFAVGDRVQDTWGNQAVVTEIDPSAEHGLGRIRVRYDDGRELSSAVVAHDLKRVEGFIK